MDKKEKEYEFANYDDCETGCQGCNGMGCTPPSTRSREERWRRWWANQKKLKGKSTLKD